MNQSEVMYKKYKMPAPQQRQTAHKIWISDLVNAQFVKQEGEWDPNYLQVKDLKISRVNVVANIVLTYKNEDGSYITLTIDDGSNQIQIKAWREDTKLIQEMNIGDTILVIGRVREYNNQIYITPEIVKKLDNPSWLKVRKIELTNLYGEPEVKPSPPPVQTQTQEIPPQEAVQSAPPPVEEIISGSESKGVSETSRQKILTLIEKHSTSEDGVEMNLIVQESQLSEEEAEAVMQDLMKEGEIFSPRPGFLKSI